MKYYKITGLNEGVPITPFAVTQEQLDAALVEHGDSCRYYEEITKDEYDQLIEKELAEMVAKELAEFEASHLDDPQSMLDVIKLLLERKFAFDVRNCSMIAEDEPLWQYVPDRAKGKDLLLLIVQISNYEWVVLEDDLETLTDCFRDIEGWC